jgi:hypothetical protein
MRRKRAMRELSGESSRLPDKSRCCADALDGGDGGLDVTHGGGLVDGHQALDAEFKLRTWAMTDAPGVALVPLTIDANAGDGRPELC